MQTGAAVGPGLGALVTRHDLNCVPPYIEIPYLKSSLASLYCDGGNLYHVDADLSICGAPPSGFAAVLSHVEHKPLLIFSRTGGGAAP